MMKRLISISKCLIAFGLLLPSVRLVAQHSPQRQVAEQSVSIKPASATQKGLKWKVAIGRFSNETQYGKGIFYDRDNDPMAKQALDILSTKLAASGKFILLERNDLALIENEIKHGASSQKIGADYLILGSITEFGRKTTGKEASMPLSRTKPFRGRLTSWLRISSTSVATSLGVLISLVQTKTVSS